MAAAFYAILLSACTEPAGSLGTEDVRVDHTGTEQKDQIDAVVPRRCVNDEGKVFVTWQDDRDGVDAVWFNMSADAGASFLANDTLLSGGDVGAANPAIACSGDRVYVVWEDKRDGDYGYENIYLQWSDDAGRHWQKEDIALDNDPEGDFMSKNPVIAAAGDNAWVAWSDQVNGAYDIFVNRTQNGGDEWLKEPVRVDTDEAGAAYSALPQIAGDKDGHVVVAWQDTRDGLSDIYANFSEDNGKSFGDSDRRLDAGDDAGSANSFNPKLAMSGENVYVVWHDERYGTNADILANLSRSYGSGWKDEAFRVESDAEGIADSRNPAVAADGDRVLVAFQDDRAVGYDIFLRWSEDAGKTWNESLDVRMDTDDNGQAQSYWPSVAIDGDTWLVAWQDYRSDSKEVGFNDLFYNYTINAGELWQSSDIRVNSSEPGSAFAVDMGVSIFEGNVVSVWADGRAGTSDIYAASRELGTASEWIPAEEAE